MKDFPDISKNYDGRLAVRQAAGDVEWFEGNERSLHLLQDG